MHPDHRQEARTRALRKPKGKLQLIDGEQHHNVTEVIDISPTGIRLEVGTPADIGTQVLVRYFDGEVDMQLNGMVIWNSPSPPGAAESAKPISHIVGIKLTSPTLLDVFL